MSDLTHLIPPGTLSERIADYAIRSKAANTTLAYRAAMRQFVAWCEGQGREPIGDLDAVAGYLTYLADRQLAASTVRLSLAAIKEAHRLAGVPLDTTEPRLAMTLEGIVRTLGVAPQRKAAAAVPDVLRRLLAAALPPDDPMGARDRAMLMVSFGAALRRSEVVALKLQDVEVVEGKGLLVTVRRSKTDQHGKGTALAIWQAETEPNFCATRAYLAWMAHRSRASDSAPTGTPPPEAPVFIQVGKGRGLARRLTGQPLTGRILARTMKKLAQDAGLDPSRFSGHSPRRGLLTAGGQNGETLADIMRHSRHKSAETALGYIEIADKWSNNVTRRVFR